MSCQCKLFSAALPLKVRLPDIDGINIDAFWPFWPNDRAFDGSLWLAVDLDKHEGPRHACAVWS